MALRFEQFLTDGIAELSYLIGDDRSGTACVVDPRPDCDVYLDAARRNRVAITHVFETHIHADFLSGARELADRCGARVHNSDEGEAEYGYEREGVRDGDRFEFGSTVMTARHTPGHTPEHLSFLLASADRPDSPWGVLSGDTLFNNSAGRPDLLGHERSEELADRIFRTLREFYLDLDDDVIVYPNHGAGSACGAGIGDRLQTTIGRERRHNAFLRYDDLEEFRRFVLGSAPPEPHHYRRLKKTNGAGPEVLGRPPVAPGLPPRAFRYHAEAGEATLLDTRDPLAFGGGHVEGAINIGDRPELSVWAGEMLDAERPILLVLERDRDLERVLRLLWRTGFTRFAGYLVGGMRAWVEAGFPLRTLPQIDVHELQRRRDDLTVLDVRSPKEWRGGHVPDAVHFHAHDLRDETPQIDRDAALAVYCGSGYRASIAASVLRRRGFENVRNVPGSWSAWTANELPVEHPGA